MKNLFKKYWWVILLLLLILIILYYLIFIYGKGEVEQTISNEGATITSAKEATKSADISVETDEDLLKKAVSEKTGIPIDEMAFEVSENTGKHATGLVNTKDAMVGGGFWLAVKMDSKWVVVFDGQNTPGCSQVDPTDFPVSMVAECFDSSGNIVVRK
ncbi:hypothetical protein IID23_01175 [Patescibacteria group bacterium]|nr:hypothetical protein [Patescibacteria group bacterium]